MALTDKNIVITPNIGASNDPKIVFSGADANTTAQNITATVYPTLNGMISFDGSAGQLLSVTNSLTGTIFSANDVSGIPSIEVLDTGLVKLAQYSGNVLIGTGTDDGTNKLQVSSVKVSSSLVLPSTSTLPASPAAGNLRFNSSTSKFEGHNGTAWGDIGGSTTKTISNKTAAYTVVSGDLGSIINCTANSFTVSLTAAATLGSGFTCTIWNTSSTSTDAITIDPNGAETIDGVATLVLRRGEGLAIVCDGTNWQTDDKKPMRGYAENITKSELRPTASGDGSLAMGIFATSSGVVSTALGYTANATSTNATAIGSNSAGSGSQAVTGAGAMALGGSYASGTDSFAAGIANNTITYGAQGSSALSIGYHAKATGAYSLAIGSGSSATGDYAMAIGWNNTAGNRSYCIGGVNNTAGDNAVIIGSWNSNIQNAYSATLGGAYASDRNVQNRWAYGLMSSPGVGAIQKGMFLLYGSTTTATPLQLRTNSDATPNTGNQMTLANDCTYAFSITVVGRRTDVDNENFAIKYDGVAVRNANVASTTIVTLSSNVLYKTTAAWDCAVTADTTYGAIAVTVTGEASKTIRWLAVCDTVEVVG